MSSAAKLVEGMMVEVRRRGRAGAPIPAEVASVVDRGVVLAPEDSADAQAFGEGGRVTIVAGVDHDAAVEASGVVAGTSGAGIAVQLDGEPRTVERRSYPRVAAVIPMRYRGLDEEAAKKARAAIRSRIPASRGVRPSELPGDRSDMSSVLARLQRLETAIDLLTDLIVASGTGLPPLTEREVVLSAGGLAFVPDEPAEIVAGQSIEVDLLLPLGEPVRVKLTGAVVRVEGDSGKVAISYDAIVESDRDEIARYVFQLQRRRRA